jgi:hypothetical protein
MGRPPCSKLCVVLSPEALLACAPLGCLWKFNPPLLSLFRTQPLGKGAQSCADSVRLTVLQAPVVVLSSRSDEPSRSCARKPALCTVQGPCFLRIDPDRQSLPSQMLSPKGHWGGVWVQSEMFWASALLFCANPREWPSLCTRADPPESANWAEAPDLPVV